MRMQKPTWACIPRAVLAGCLIGMTATEADLADAAPSALAQTADDVRLVGANGAVMPQGIKFEGVHKTSVAPSDAQIAHIETIIANDQRFAWLSARHYRFFWGMTHRGEQSVRVGFSCEAHVHNVSEASRLLSAFHALLSVSDGGACYGFAKFSWRTGNLVWVKTNGEA